MDFNTGTGGTGSSGGSPSGSGGPRPRVSAGAPGGEFNYTDPIQSFSSTVQRVVLQPADFFRGIRRQGDFLNPLIFAIICTAISALLSGIIAVLIAAVGAGDQGFGAAAVGFFGGVILAPIYTAVGLFIGAGIFHLLVMLLVRPSNAGFEATFRVVAYASVTQLVSWLAVIPILGILVSLIVGLYGLFLAVVGIREVHSTTTGTAALVVLIPAVVVFLLLVLLLGSALLLYFSAQQ